jgi:hypothetical protein
MRHRTTSTRCSADATAPAAIKPANSNLQVLKLKGGHRQNRWPPFGVQETGKKILRESTIPMESERGSRFLIDAFS